MKRIPRVRSNCTCAIWSWLSASQSTSGTSMTGTQLQWSLKARSWRGYGCSSATVRPTAKTASWWTALTFFSSSSSRCFKALLTTLWRPNIRTPSRSSVWACFPGVCLQGQLVETITQQTHSVIGIQWSRAQHPAIRSHLMSNCLVWVRLYRPLRRVACLKLYKTRMLQVMSAASSSRPTRICRIKYRGRRAGKALFRSLQPQPSTSPSRSRWRALLHSACRRTSGCICNECTSTNC